MSLATTWRGCWGFTGACLIAAGALAINLPQAVAAAPAAPLTDVALRSDGTLFGQVVNSSGVPVPNAAVSLRVAGQEVATGVTNRDGYFAFSGLRAGTCEMTTVRGSGAFRVWDARVAPPSAQPGALLVATDRADGALVRGQGALQFLTQPLVVGAALGLGIGAGTTVAIYEGHRHPASSY